MSDPCVCGRIHSLTDVQAAGRFQPDSPTRYAAAGHPARATRAEAMRDHCPHWTQETP